MKPIDLTLTISQKLPTFPGSPPPQFIPWSNIRKDGYNLELLCFSSHSGTHMDAPYHFLRSGLKMEQIPVKRFVCNAVLIKLKKNENESISKKDIVDFEKNFGKIDAGGTVIFATEWEEKLHKDFYFNRNPGLDLSSARYLAYKKVNLVGIDSPSIDMGKNTNFSSHKILAKNNVLIVENLCNLNQIHSNNFKLVVLPLKLKNATGSPVRAIAV